MINEKLSVAIQILQFLLGVQNANLGISEHKYLKYLELVLKIGITYYHNNIIVSRVCLKQSISIIKAPTIMKRSDR